MLAKRGEQPGAAGYRAISVNIDPSPEVRVLPMNYPSSEIYYFEPLKGRVPVLQKPFRLVQDGTPQAQAALRGRENVAIKGILEYQECDDKQCFNPVAVPLSWTVSLRPIALQRTNRGQ